MSIAADPIRFPAAMRAIHWATALSMGAVLVLAWVLPRGHGPEGMLLMLHKSVGLAILALSALRLILRNLSHLPRDPDDTPWFEAAGARAVHVLLYGLLFAMPLTGYISDASRGRATDVFGLFQLPALVPVSSTLHAVAWTLHSAGETAIYIVVGAHVAASLFHLVVRRDGVMTRMWPGVERFMPPQAAHPAAE